MAYRRRSLALALIAIGFAVQWIPWARIDRAAFQYHYYTALPFIVLALAYFIAEVWHGASRFTWQFARARRRGGASCCRPRCGCSRGRSARIVGVESVNPDSAACPAVIPDFVLTTRTAALAVVAGVGLFFVLRAGPGDLGRRTATDRRGDVALVSHARDHRAASSGWR